MKMNKWYLEVVSINRQPKKSKKKIKKKKKVIICGLTIGKETIFIHNLSKNLRFGQKGIFNLEQEWGAPY